MTLVMESLVSSKENLSLSRNVSLRYYLPSRPGLLKYYYQTK